ncbi:hypothetical protein [Microvirga solisilvae]|uniref:hypothetical protein n=1 Tax=Microvirga solisilvae TaxID=2919498 RepID=UPI001FB02C93|nr:hypothetical protein [Microvirga solisilvae]
MNGEQQFERLLSSTWNALKIVSSQLKPSKRDPEDNISFFDCAWKRFDSRHVISRLLARDESYFAHREALFAAFCAYVVAPRKPGLRKSSIALTAARLMIQAERKVRDQFDGDAELADFYMRMHGYGRDFLEEIYYPIGGLRTLSIAPSPKQLKSKFAEEAENLPYLVTMMKVHHYNLQELTDRNKYLPPSQAKSAALVKELKIHKPKVNQKAVAGQEIMEDHWRRHSQTVAFLYAASDIYVTQNRSLLDLLLAGELTYDQHYKHFHEWIGRTAFVVRDIMGKLSKAEEAVQARKLMPIVSPIAFRAPKFAAVQVETIRGKYTPKKLKDSAR